MARVKRAVNAHKKRRETLEHAAGYRGQRSRLYRKAKEQVQHSLVYSYRDRRARKGEFRKLWIQRINAAARAQGDDVQPVHPGAACGRDRGRPQDPRRPRRQRPGRVRPARRHRQGSCPRRRRRRRRPAPDRPAAQRPSHDAGARGDDRAVGAGQGGPPAHPAGPASPRGCSSRRVRRRCARRWHVGCVVEVFATPAATPATLSWCGPRRRGSRLAPGRRRRGREPDRTRSPQGLVAVCRSRRRRPDATSTGREPGSSPSARTSVIPAMPGPSSGAPTRREPTRSYWRGPPSTPTTARRSGPARARCSTSPSCWRPRSSRPGDAARAGLVVLAADGAGDVSLDDLGPIARRPTAWLFGNEAWGLPPDLAGSPTTSSGSRSTERPRASTSRPPRPSACTARRASSGGRAAAGDSSAQPAAAAHSSQ